MCFKGGFLHILKGKQLLETGIILVTQLENT